MEKSANKPEEKQSTIRMPNNMIKILSSPGLEFFKRWCIFLRPIINLTNREIDVIASFLNQRWELSKSINDEAILDTMVMSEATKNKVIKECNITQQHFYVVMSNLRKNKVILDNKINSRLIPNMRKDDNGCFQLLILFKDNTKEKVKKKA